MVIEKLHHIFTCITRVNTQLFVVRGGHINYNKMRKTMDVELCSIFNPLYSRNGKKIMAETEKSGKSVGFLRERFNLRDRLRERNVWLKLQTCR